MFWRLGLLVLLFTISALDASGQGASVVLFDDEPAGANYRDASSGMARDGDFLRLGGPGDDKLPIDPDHSLFGEHSGLLEWRHVAGGQWEMAVDADGAPVDLTGFDSLVVHLNGPDTLTGIELPRIGLRDVDGGRTERVWLSTPRDVRVDEAASGFTAESPTNAVFDAQYLNVLPREVRRPGYPEDLVITFADMPLDTSQAAIGAPATPARFRITTEEGRPLDFRFRDVDGDGTVSAEGEFIDVLTPEAEGSTQQRPTWRIELDAARVQGALVPPGEGDVYRLVLAVNAFALDADPATWQRLSLPLLGLLPSGDFAPEALEAILFTNGGVNPAVRTLWVDRITAIRNDDDAFLDEIQRVTFDYFWQEANPQNGLIRDRSRPGSPASIAAVGFGLSAYTVGIDRGWISRVQGRQRVLNTLRFFWNAPQSGATNVTGYKGFFYHFLDMDTGRRAWNSELSTIDTALLLGGVLHVGEYFTGDDPEEAEIRALADSIYYRVDWQWAQNNPPRVTLSWKPETGFNNFDWSGYNEAMILYLLALGSPTHPVEPAAWTAWTSTYDWETHYGYAFVVFPPLFGHQYSHVWIDFRSIQDAYMREKGIDYFENSRRATLAQRAYHEANPKGWPNYDENEWGLTASDAPDGYLARGAPPARNDEGTLAPTAPGGSIVFTPEGSIATLRHMRETYPRLWGPYGFRDAYNVAENWFDTDYLGIDQGPILLMIENHRTGRIWDVFMQNEDVQRGLARAGFEETATAAEPDAGPPDAPVLHASYPNPFAGEAEIRFTLSRPGDVALGVYDVLGRKVATLVEGVRPAGTHTVAVDASAWPSGVYFYRLQTGDVVATRTMVLRR